MSRELELMTGATKALAEVSSAKDAWQLSRTAEAARRWAQMKGLGVEAINYATGIKAKAMVLLADFVDAEQAAGTVAKPGSAGRGRSLDLPDEKVYSVSGILGIEGDDADAKAYKAVHEARRLRDDLAGQDVDALVRDANVAGQDFGIRGLRRAAAGDSPTHGPDPARLCYQALGTIKGLLSTLDSVDWSQLPAEMNASARSDMTDLRKLLLTIRDQLKEAR